MENNTKENIEALDEIFTAMGGPAPVPDSESASVISDMKSDLTEFMADKDPAAVFTMLFHTYFPRMELLVNKMSNKELRRFIKAMFGGELVDRKKTLTKDQLEAYAIGDRLLESRYFMIFARYLDVQMENEKQRLEIEAAATSVEVPTVEISFS